MRLAVVVRVVMSISAALIIMGSWRFYSMAKASDTQGPPLGVQEGQLLPCSSKPNCVSTSSTGEHSIEPLAGTPEDLPALIQALESMGGRVTLREGNYVRAEFRSKIFRFVDDVELLATPEGIQVRSASRVGYSDLGVNRKRMEELRKRFKENQTGA